MSTFIYPSISIDTTGLATEAKQDDIIAELVDVNSELDTQTAILTGVASTDFATQTTLAAVLTELQLKADLTETQPVSAASLPLPTGAATETTLLTVASDTTSIDSKITAVDTDNVTVISSSLPTGAATSANQTTANASLANIESDLDNLNARLAGNLVPETFDEVVLTYIGSTDRINTVVYKLSTVVVATLTLTYDGSDRLSGVLRS